jgi:hypothetical protein
MNGLCRGLEQQVITLPLVDIEQPFKKLWHRENYMEIAAGQKFMLELIYPNNLLDVLAFGTMPVTAGIIAYALVPASVTMGHMASHC